MFGFKMSELFFAVILVCLALGIFDRSGKGGSNGKKNSSKNNDSSSGEL